MRRIAFASLWLLLVSLALLSTGCGPGLVALGGGGTGTWFGLAGGDDDDDDPPPPAPVGPNVAPAVIVSALVREESPARIQYTLIDANADVCSVEVEFSVGGGPFTSCLQGAGGDPITGLTSSPGGTTHEFRWDFLTDLGPQRTTGIDIRIRANDGAQFGSWFTLAGLSIGNDGPEISNINVIGTGGVLLITFDLADQNSDLGSLGVEWSTDQAQNFTEVNQGAEVLGNPPVNLLSSPAGSPGQFIWQSGIALSNYVGEFYLRFSAFDQPAGYTSPTPASPVVAGPFVVDNSINQPPTLNLARAYSGQSFVSTVPIDFTLADGESDNAAVVVKYTLNGGGTLLDATLRSQFAPGQAGPFSTNPSPTFYSVTWDALTDLQDEAGFLSPGVDVQLVLVPVDGQAGSVAITPVFTVIGNSAPAVNAISVLNTFGNIPVVVNIADESSDPVSIEVEYSTDGTNFTFLSQADFAFGSLTSLVTSPTGEDNVLVWDSSLVLGGINEPAVYLRVTPTDHPASAAPSPATLMDLTGLAFTSAGFPIINNPAGAAPVSVSIYTTDSPATPPTASPASSPQYVTVAVSSTRTFDRTIQPASATTTDTFWFIDEDTADFGTLQTAAGGSLTFSTASLTCAGPTGIDGDTVTIDDVKNGPTTFEFDDNSLMVIGNMNVDISTAATADDVAAALAAAINSLSGFAISAQATGADVTLTHKYAAKITQSTAVAPTEGAATPISTSGTAVTVNSDMQGGIGSQIVRYVAPAAFPGGSNGVTIKCFIDHPSFFQTVQASYPLAWGQQPTSVAISPSNPSVLINGSQSFAATVSPGGAPQFVTWEVVGGTVNGTISPGGFYQAPPTMPASNLVTIRATSILSTVSGTTTVTLLPEPTNVIVDSAGSVSTLTLSMNLQFTASVLPSAAPQGVTWRIRHGGVDQGPGNAVVGTINSSGLYSAPNLLPSPNTVVIEAVSTAKTSVFGQFTLTLQAPAPTSFDVTPSTATVFAGGAGQQFNTTNFVPTNANQAVTWEVIPSTGHGTVSGSGFYTPPASIAATTFVTVRAKSSVNQAIFDDAIVTLNPNVATIPTDVVITPTEAIATTQSGIVQFSASVNPGTASQSVTWAVSSGPGSVDASGRYTPANSAVDYTATVRATSTVSPFPSATATVRVTGNGQQLQDIANLPIGRGDHSSVWDPSNDRVWYLGGVSETSYPDADLNPLWYDTGADQFGSGPPLTTAATFTTAPKSIMAALDNPGKKLYAFCNMGASNPVRVFTLNLAPLASAWVEISIGGGGDAPTLLSSLRYPCWFDESNATIYMLVGNNNLYRFSPGGNWLSKQTVSQTSQGPNQPLNNAWVWDQSTRICWFAGPSDGTAGASMRLSRLDVSGTKWELKSSSGNPTVGQANGGMFFHQNKLWLFGGRNVQTNVIHNSLWEINTQPTVAQWSPVAQAGLWPMPRVRPQFTLVSAGTNPVLFAGSNDTGSFGDLWSFSETTKAFSRANPGDLRPQGRSNAAAVWTGSMGIVYGGSCDHGVSDELWAFTYQTSPVRLQWSPMATGGIPPPPLQDAVMLHDSGNNRVYLFGGTTTKTKSGGQSGGLYMLDLNTAPATWSQLTPGGGSGPTPRWGASACFSYNGAAVRSMWIFGGEGTGKNSELWELDLQSGPPGNWSLRSSSGGPDAREGAAMGWDSRRNRILVVGGKNAAGSNHQYFEFDPTLPGWASRSPSNTGSQEDFYDSGAIYEDLHRRFLHAPFAKPKYQALVVTTGVSQVVPSWHYMTAPGTDHATATSGLFDPVAGRYYALFGERTISGRPSGTNGAAIIHVK